MFNHFALAQLALTVPIGATCALIAHIVLRNRANRSIFTYVVTGTLVSLLFSLLVSRIPFWGIVLPAAVATVIVVLMHFKPRSDD